MSFSRKKNKESGMNNTKKHYYCYCCGGVVGSYFCFLGLLLFFVSLCAASFFLFRGRIFSQNKLFIQLFCFNPLFFYYYFKKDPKINEKS